MKNKTGYVIAFVVGAFAGSAVSIRIMKDRYARIAQEEIDSVKETFSKRYERDAKVDEIRKMTDDGHDMSEIVEKLGYADGTVDEEFEEKEEKPAEGPYIISPEEFDEKAEDGYEAITLTYYSDGVLADENDEPIDDIANTIGEYSLNHFGEYEDDSVYVRDDWRKVDYEILRDERPYSQILEENPYLRNKVV